MFQQYLEFYQYLSSSKGCENALQEIRNIRDGKNPTKNRKMFQLGLWLLKCSCAL